MLTEEVVMVGCTILRPLIEKTNVHVTQGRSQHGNLTGSAGM